MEEILPFLILALGLYYWYNKANDSAQVTAGNFVDQKVVFRKSIEDFVMLHKRALAIQRRQLVKVDHYGKEVFDLWNREMDYFIEHHITPKFGHQSMFGWSEEELTDFKRIIERLAKKEEALINKEAATSGFHDGLTGHEFEEFCKFQLQNLGWEVTLTKKTGDQGVDLIAVKEDIRIAVQCKKYSTTIGNKAVQEVVAGMQFYGTDFGIVITNSTFTSSAKQLAKANKILLLHFNELEKI